jgi:Flp pilus assembly protein TadD
MVSVDVMLTGSIQDPEALAVRDSLMIALSRFNTLRLTTGTYTANAGHSRPDARTYSRYEILLKYASDGHGKSIRWQVTDDNSGETIRAGEERMPTDGLSPEDADEQLISKLAVRLASLRGVINTIETARDLENPSLGNGCVLRAGLGLTTGNSELRANARSCLERTLELRPFDADAHAMLAAILLADGPSSELTELASQHAEQAVALAPESDRSYMAQMLATFRAGRVETAREAGRRAFELNPNNPAIVARYAGVLFASGDWERATELAAKASMLEGAPNSDAERTLAFDAFRRGDFQGAVARLKQLPERHCQMTQILLAAALAKSGQGDAARLTVAGIRRSNPNFESTFLTNMASRQLTPTLVNALSEGLKQAGSKIE